MQTLFPESDGLELMSPPVSYAQRIRPEAASTANMWPSLAPK